jgi:hypothetical protein
VPGTFSRVRAVPWVIVVQTALAANARWRAMAPKDRERLTKLLKTSKGRPANLSAREREDVKRLLGELDLQGLARELGPFMRARRRRRRR